MRRVSFEDENPTKDFLSEEQMGPFYDRMRRTVVVIESKFMNQPSQPNNPQKRHFKDGKRTASDNKEFSKGTGVFFHARALILTCFHILEGCDQFGVRSVDEIDFGLATLVNYDEPSDLAILKLKEMPDADYAALAEAGSVSVGMQVAGVSNPSDLIYSFTVGRVAYPCNTQEAIHSDIAYNRTKGCRIVGDVRRRGLDHDLMSYDAKLKIIQMNNIHGSSGGSGGPVFDTNGRVIGIFLFILKGFDFAIHVSEIQKFIDVTKHEFPEEFYGGLGKQEHGRREGEKGPKKSNHPPKGKRNTGKKGGGFVACAEQEQEQEEEEEEEESLRNDSKGMALCMAEFKKKLGVGREDLPKYEEEYLELKMAKVQLEELKKDDAP